MFFPTSVELAESRGMSMRNDLLTGKPVDLHTCITHPLNGYLVLRVKMVQRLSETRKMI
jgi:hypothetical protein